VIAGGKEAAVPRGEGIVTSACRTGSRATAANKKPAGKFLNIGNVTMVSVVVENSQNERAVNLQRFMNCEMQFNFALNVHVEVPSYIFQRNKMCISVSVHPVYVLYTVDI
jgi:hypothetical protein